MLFLACNLNVALADVMIDATVAEQTKRRPELGAELQALCWGALGAVGPGLELYYYSIIVFYYYTILLLYYYTTLLYYYTTLLH